MNIVMKYRKMARGKHAGSPKWRRYRRIVRQFPEGLDLLNRMQRCLTMAFAEPSPWQEYVQKVLQHQRFEPEVFTARFYPILRSTPVVFTDEECDGEPRVTIPIEQATDDERKTILTNHPELTEVIDQ